MDPEEYEGLKEEFEQIDTDHSGYVSINELKKAIENNGMSKSTEEINAIIEKLDDDGNKLINFTEFLASTVVIDKNKVTEQRR